MDISYRTIELDQSIEENAFSASLSSDAPYLRPFGLEVLNHAPVAIDLTRAKNGLPFLFNHDTDEPIGIVEGVRTDGQKLRGVVRFFTTSEAQEYLTMVKQGLRSISIGYVVKDMVSSGTSDGQPVFSVNQWELLEASLVAVPADPTVGIGRSINLKGSKMENIQPHENEKLSRSQQRAMASSASKREEEISSILALAEMHSKRIPGLMHDAAEHIRNGGGVEQFRVALLDRLSYRNEETTTVNFADFNPRELESYSVTRAVQAAASGDWSKAGLEREMSREIERSAGRSARGIFIPMGALQTRVMNTGTVGAGGALVPTMQGNLIEILRPVCRVISAGATVMSGLDGNLDLPKQDTGVSAEWLAEDGALTGGDIGFGVLSLSPKTVGAMTSWTRRMLLQSVPGIEEIARQDLMAIVGQAIDKAALHGLGSSNQPTGIYSASGVNTVAMGGVPTHGKLIDMVGLVATDDALMGNCAFLTTPGMAAKLAQTLVASAAGSEMVWNGAINEGKLAGYSAFSTNQVSSTLGGGSEHGIVFGNFSELIIGMWHGGIDLLVDPYTYADRGRIRLTAFSDIDLGLRHGESFCKATGATV